jgi:hypothetical protein
LVSRLLMGTVSIWNRGFVSRSHAKAAKDENLSWIRLLGHVPGLVSEGSATTSAGKLGTVPIITSMAGRDKFDNIRAGLAPATSRAS